VSTSAIGSNTISFTDAVRFFRIVTNSGPCPMCSAVAWTIPVNQMNGPVSLVPSGNNDDSGSPVMELKLSCDVCGYFRSHNATIIRKWISENPADDEPTNG